MNTSFPFHYCLPDMHVPLLIICMGDEDGIFDVCECITQACCVWCSKHLQCIYVDRDFKKGDISVSTMSSVCLWPWQWHVTCRADEWQPFARLHAASSLSTDAVPVRLTQQVYEGRNMHEPENMARRVCLGK